MKSKSISLNFIMNFLLTASSILFPLITFPYVSRVLGPTGTGAVAMGTSLVSYFTMVAMLGVPTYGIRACAQVRDDKKRLSKTVQELLIINLIMALVSYIAFFILLWLVPAFREESTLYTICSAAIILNVIGVNWVYQALEEYSYITFVSVLFKALGLGLMFLLVRNAGDVLWFGFVTVVSSFGSAVFNFLRLRKLIDLHPCGHWNFRRHLYPIFTFFFMSVATTVYTNLDTVMLGVMKNNEVVGYYNAAIKIKTILVTLVTSLGTVLLPRLSYYYEQGKEKEFLSLVSKAFSFVLLFSIPCCIYFSVYAKPVVEFLSGPGYLPAVAPMIILMPTILFIGLSNITGIQVLVPTGRETLVLRSVILGAVVDFLLNLILIPLLGASGAAIGTLCAEFAVTLLQFWYLRKLLTTIIRSIEFKELLIMLLVSTPVIWLVSNLRMSKLFCQLFISAVVYFGICGLVLLALGEKITNNLIKRILGILPERN
ncbi:flippase [Faecalibaculum rodentium]|uniref:flippase n=4 Tax=Faecalibaculum rodentium TaxID=1702221 RepID=UPI00256F346D|nr:flippase [Faecalibaculum rodentium]